MDLLLYLIMLLLPFLAQLYVKSTFNRYSTMHSSRGLTADQVARKILDSNGIYNTGVEHTPGDLSDHYDPISNVINLSDTVYGKSSVAAIGVAAHECGHVCQHQQNYLPIIIRSKIVPVVNFCSQWWCYVLMAGIALTYLIRSTVLIYPAIIMYTAVVIFQIVTLPTEFDASSRAMKTLRNDGILENDELPAARKVLTAAALTYVANLTASLIQLFRLISMVDRRR